MAHEGDFIYIVGLCSGERELRDYTNQTLTRGNLTSLVEAIGDSYDCGYAGGSDYMELGVFGVSGLGFTLGRFESGYMALCPRLRFLAYGQRVVLLLPLVLKVSTLSVLRE